MLFKHTTRKGDPVELHLADETTCHELLDVVNLEREKLRRACLSAEEMAVMLRTHNIIYTRVRGQVTGVCIYKPSRPVIVDWLAVAPEYRRHYIAAYLLKSISLGLSGRSRPVEVSVPEHADAMIGLLSHCDLQSRVDSDDPTVYVFAGVPKYVFSDRSKQCA